MQSQLAAHADDSFDAAVARHTPTLREAARRLTGSLDEADDLVQDAVMRAWTFWDRFEPGSNARAWLHRILVNTFINAYRKQRRERELFRLAGRRGSCARPSRSAICAPRERDGLGDEVGARWLLCPPSFAPWSSSWTSGTSATARSRASSVVRSGP